MELLQPITDDIQYQPPSGKVDIVAFLHQTISKEFSQLRITSRPCSKNSYTGITHLRIF